MFLFFFERKVFVLKRLYCDDPYLKFTNATVLEVHEKGGLDLLVFDRTVFYPEGGGQKCDIGTVSRLDGSDDLYKVTSVNASSTQAPVCHLTDAPFGTFSEGECVRLEIDWDRRFSNMQRHTGEHLLSGVFHSMFGGVNKGFHMSKDYIAIDIDLDGKILTAEEVSAVEDRVNELIWQDLPVATHRFPTYEDSLVLPVRKQVPHEGEVSVVCIGNEGELADCIACCGTHVSSTGQIGMVSVRKSEPNKGMTRVFFDCGSNAYRESKKDRAVVLEAAGRYSCGRDDLLSRLESEREHAAEHKARIAELAAFACDQELKAISEALSPEDDFYPASFTSSLLTSGELVKLGFKAAELLPENGCLLLSSQSESQVLLFSRGGISCSDIVKENAGAFSGKGGGRPDNARASFPSRRDAEAFISHVCRNVL